MLLRSLETLELRMSRAGENAGRICAWLREQPEVERVVYLGFPENDRQRDIYERHCTGAGSTFSLYLKGGEKEAFAFLDARSEAHTSELKSLMTISSAVLCLTNKPTENSLQ